MRVISLGAGVQSTALLLLALAGEVEADCAIFADTQSEPIAVYEHLARLRLRCGEAGFPLYLVTAGNLGAKINSGGYVDIPLFQTNADGSRGQGRRQCTYQFKVRPIRRMIRELAGRGPTDLLMGISLDEIARMRDSDVGYIRNVYPLVERRWTRWDCQRYLASRDVEAPRSACVFCPYRTNAEWRALTDAEFDEASRVDEAVRDMGDGRSGYLHAARSPLRQIDLTTAEDHGQQNWLGECVGICGI